MKIKYFGTAAYEGIPALFCQCESCKRAMRLGGKNLRTRSQALINDEFLMDFNADTLAHYYRFKFDWEKIKYCLITHSHSDHFYPEDLLMFAEPYYTHGASPIDFYSGESTCERIRQLLSNEVFSVKGDNPRLILHEVREGDLVQLGENKLLVLHADHDIKSTPLIYAIEDKDGKRILYANDTGMFNDDVFTQMKRLGRFDIVSFDCTGSVEPTGWDNYHMSMRTNALMKKRMIDEGLADNSTVFVVTHFSHNALFGHDHEELCIEAEKYGFVVAYDGFEVEV